MRQLTKNSTDRYLLSSNNIIITVVFLFQTCIISSHAQACCYMCGQNFYWGIDCCTTREECLHSAIRRGCIINEVRSNYFVISCDGGTYGCGVNPSINCCAVNPNSSCCMGSNPDPCCKNPDDPCCMNDCCDNPPDTCPTGACGDHGAGSGPSPSVPNPAGPGPGPSPGPIGGPFSGFGASGGSDLGEAVSSTFEGA